MKAYVLGIAFAGCAIGLLVLSAYAAAPTSTGSAARSTETPAAPAGAVDQAMDDTTQSTHTPMSAEMRLRCRMLMNTVVVPGDPGAILSLRESLKLTDAQAAKLEVINREARDKAAAVLTADQKKTLDAMPQAPETMRAIHDQVMQQLQMDRRADMMRRSRMDFDAAKCPLMKMIDAEPTAAAQPKDEGPVVTEGYHAPQDQ